MIRRRKRRIIWEEHAKRPALEAAEIYPRLYDVIRNFEWLLERHPDNDFAEQIDETFWIIKSEAFPLSGPGVPRATLIYTFDDKTVTFRDIRIEPPAPYV